MEKTASSVLKPIIIEYLALGKGMSHIRSEKLTPTAPFPPSSRDMEVL